MARNTTKQPKPREIDVDIHEVSKLFQSEFDDEFLERCLNKARVRPTDKPELPPKIMTVGGSVLATFGNFSASTGKAKSKKTFNISAMVAAALTNGTVLNYTASLPQGKKDILYFDTEQSTYHCHNVLNRILILAGLTPDQECDRITFIGLREFTPAIRRSMIDYALRKKHSYGLVIIDGLRDLMYDINDAKEATDLMTRLMNWTSTYKLHIHCVLHLNKNDSNTRGHIGTELENKAESVLVVSKSKNNPEISEVRPMHMRDREFSTFAFHIDENGLPVLEDDYQVSTVKIKETPLVALPGDVHKNILKDLFDHCKPQTYKDLVGRMGEYYAKYGYKRGTNAIKDLLKRLTQKEIVKRDDNIGYVFNADLIDVDSEV